MKLLKTLSFGLMAAATVTTASAATELHIAGSTAFRAAATAAIVNYLGAGYTCAWDDSSGGTGIYNSPEVIFKKSDGSVIIKTHWTGSLAGVVDLATQNKIGFPVDATATAAGPAAGTGGGAGTQLDKNGANGGIAYTEESVAPDMAFSDSFASSVYTIAATANPFGAPVNGQASPAALSSLIKNSSLVDAGTGAGSGPGPIGIVPFEWVAGNQTSAVKVSGGAATAPPFTNITSNVAQNLIAGPTAVSLFPGNTDSTTPNSVGTPQNAVDFVYLVGRNEDSGTRIDTYAVAGVGLNPSTVAQEQLTFNSNPAGNDGDGYATGGITSTVTGVGLFPSQALNTEPGITWNKAGHSGYVAGADVAAVLSSLNPLTVIPANAPPEQTPGGVDPNGNTYIVGYVGLSDASKVYYGTALSYNGVPFSPANVANGTYNLWSLEHLYYLGGNNANKLVNPQLGIANSLADSIYLKYACTNSSAKTAASHSTTDEAAVNSGAGGVVANVFNGAGLYYNDGVALFGVQSDGGTYTLNY